MAARGAPTSQPTVREFSAGGLVVRRFHGRPWLACIRVKGGAVLALPKGHVDPGESAAEAAAREVREETGVEATLVEKLDDVRYWYRRPGARVFKVVSFFLFRYARGRLGDLPAAYRHEVAETSWLPLADAPRLLAYKGEREMAGKALQLIDDRAL